MNKTDLFKASKKLAGFVEVPEWGIVEFRKLTLVEVGEFEKYKGDVGRGLAYLICAAVVDNAGNRFFDDSDIDNILALPAEITLPIANAIAKTMGIMAEQIDAAKKN